MKVKSIAGLVILAIVTGFCGYNTVDHDVVNPRNRKDHRIPPKSFS